MDLLVSKILSLLHLVLPYVTWQNYLLLVAYLVPSTFVLFVLLMHFDRVKDKLTPDLVFIGEKVLLPIGALHNFLFNVLVATFLFLDMPREATTTARLDRYWMPAGAGLRKRIALFIRRRLDPFDKRGIHS